MRFLLLLPIITVGVTVLASSNAEEPPSLKSPDAAQRFEARNGIVQYRKDVIQEALSLLTDRESPLSLSDQRLQAIQVLGAFRAKEAASTLVKAVGIQTLVILSDHSRGDTYPAAGALVSIGKPSVPHCIDALGKTTDTERRHTLCWVIEQIEGKEIGRLLLGRALENSRGAAANNLKAAVDYFREEETPKQTEKE